MSTIPVTLMGNAVTPTQKGQLIAKRRDGVVAVEGEHTRPVKTVAIEVRSQGAAKDETATDTDALPAGSHRSSLSDASSVHKEGTRQKAIGRVLAGQGNEWFQALAARICAIRSFRTRVRCGTMPSCRSIRNSCAR
jgi:hypothetical protein